MIEEYSKWEWKWEWKWEMKMRNENEKWEMRIELLNNKKKIFSMSCQINI